MASATISCKHWELLLHSLPAHGAYREAEDAPQGAFGGPLGAFGGPLGAFGGPLGAFGGPLGALREVLLEVENAAVVVGRGVGDE